MKPIALLALFVVCQLAEGKTVPLADYAERCRKMLALQIAVSDGTRALRKAMEGTADKKPGPKEKETAAKLAGQEKVIIQQATTAIDMLNAEGVAVAFTEVFQELRADMERVQRRLEMGDVGPATQSLQQDIIDILKEMLGAIRTPR